MTTTKVMSTCSVPQATCARSYARQELSLVKGAMANGVLSCSVSVAIEGGGMSCTDDEANADEEETIRLGMSADTCASAAQSCSIPNK